MPNPKYNGWEFRRMSLRDRFLVRAITIPEHPCWEWDGHRDRDGYGKMNIGDRPEMAHRVSYRLFKGEIPDGLTIDHLCRNRSCVNPDHLEAVTIRENVMRSPIAPAAVNSRKMHCSLCHGALGHNGFFRICEPCTKEKARLRHILRKNKKLEMGA